jgi:putative Mg2+ transporter-C (MgtC) family protein
METSLVPLLQLLLASFLGGLLGIERTVAGKSAGIRTYSLVSLGSALFMILGASLSFGYIGGHSEELSRIAAGVITGVGFIGAGMIFSKDNSRRGLTSAAGLWTSAGIGMAVGAGQYSVAVFATLLVLFIFTGVWFFEERVKDFKTPEAGA